MTRASSSGGNALGDDYDGVISQSRRNSNASSSSTTDDKTSTISHRSKNNLYSAVSPTTTTNKKRHRHHHKSKNHHHHHYNPLLEAFQKNEKFSQYHETQDDEYGNSITDLLNTRPEFHFSQQNNCRSSNGIRNGTRSVDDDTSTTTSETIEDNDMSANNIDSFQPIFSKQNWKRLQAVLQYIMFIMIHIKPKEDIQYIFQTVHKFLFWSMKPTIWGTIIGFVGLLLLFLSILAAGIVYVSVSIIKFGMVIGMIIFNVLVDWKEISKAMPPGIHTVISQISDTLIWIDLNMLKGKRFRGREWNKDDFELDLPANTAQSSQRKQYLWRFPPPSVREGGTLHCADISYIKRKEWSKDTTEHIAAIDYCYLVLREDFVNRQYKKLRKSVLKRSASNDSGTDDDDLDDERMTFKDNNSISTTSIISTARTSPEPHLPSLDEEIVAEHNGRSSITRGNVAAIEKELSLRLKDILESDDDESFETPRNNNTERSRDNSIGSGSDHGSDMNWMDVGAEIGYKLLGSAAVQKAMTSHDTAEKISTIKERVESHISATRPSRNIVHTPLHRHERLDYTTHTPSLHDDGNADERTPSQFTRSNTFSLPVHSMWTSASNAVSPTGSIDTHEEQNASLIASFSDTERLDDSINGSARLSSLLCPIENIESNDASFDNDIHSKLPDFSSAKESEEIRTMKKSMSFDHPQRRRSSTRKPAIELVCDKNNYQDVKIKSGTPKVEPIKRPLLLPGVKIVVPIFPLTPGGPRSSLHSLKSRVQMATVVSSKRLCVYKKNKMPRSGKRGTNCLSITVKLDKCFLRNGEFATMTLRIMDGWGPRYMPKHSKLPLGACVSTSFGLGVLVGWRVEDDCHIVRSLWQRRGPGSSCAYLRRDSIHSTMEACVGFEVETTLGHGTVVAYVNGGSDFRCGRYSVLMNQEGRHHGQVLQLNRADVLSCKSAPFIPVIEHIREAAQYQLQIDFYEELLKESDDDQLDVFNDNKLLGDLSKYSNIIWRSFLRAIDEDDEFDEGMNEFIQTCIDFLNQLDAPSTGGMDKLNNGFDSSFVITTTESSSHSSKKAASVSTHRTSDKNDSGFWLTNNMFGIFGVSHMNSNNNSIEQNAECIEIECLPPNGPNFDKSYERAFAVLRTLMRTVTIAQAASVNEPDFKMALSVCYEFLLFVKTVIKVQRKNMNPESLIVWRRAWDEIVSVFGPVKERLTKIGEGIAERMEKHGRRAKVRLLRFVDYIVQDEALLLAIEHGEWSRCAEQVELAFVRAKIIDETSREHYHKTAQFIYNHFAAANARSKSAAARNNEKVEQFLMFVQLMANPRKAILKLFLQDWFFDMLERIFVRVFSGEPSASRMLTIHSSNFHTLRQFRMLKDFTIAGKLWIPLLDAADEEISWAVSKMPDNAKEFLSPLSSLFSLCVVQFHKINGGDLTKDWLDFLMEDEAANIIHDIDMKLILALESFSRDVKETMLVLPYYPSIDDDILNLVDEVDIDEFVKEASVALEDDDKLRDFIKEKAIIAIERFLDYLPKMSIPVEKRDLADGWTLTCRGADGGHLKLKDLVIKRENLTCQVMGGDTIFFPMLGGSDDTSTACSHVYSPVRPTPVHSVVKETSILDHIREMILNAQRYGCWQIGVGGVNHPPTDKHVASALHGLPVSSVLNCAIDLWRNLEIDDDELLEIAIRDVSYQIQLHKQREDEGDISTVKETKEEDFSAGSISLKSKHQSTIPAVASFVEPTRHRFNPRVDPTILYLEIKNLSFNLEDFQFRIEKHENKRTIFDPVFEGNGSLLVQNVAVKLRIECVKDYIKKGSKRVAVPSLQLRELDVTLEKVNLRVQHTGADWLLNKIVEGFGDRFTEIMSTNLCDQLRMQIEETLQNLNGYFEVNPDVLLGILDISVDDLDERVVWV